MASWVVSDDADSLIHIRAKGQQIKAIAVTNPQMKKKMDEIAELKLKSQRQSGHAVSEIHAGAFKNEWT
jgi:hypothetical protein